jgi:hypothetical protein
MKQLSSMMVGLACNGSSTPPMPTPPGQVHVLTDLRARADGGPSVHHRAFADIGADVDVGGHENRIRRDVGTATHHCIRHDAYTFRAQACFVVAGVLERHLVEELRVAGIDDAVVVQAEREQHAPSSATR